VAAFLEANHGYTPDGWTSRDVPPLELPAPPLPRAPAAPLAEAEDDDAASVDSDGAAAFIAGANAAAADADAAVLDVADDEAEMAQLEALLAAAQQPHASVDELLGYGPTADAEEGHRRYMDLVRRFLLAAKHGRVDVAALLVEHLLHVDDTWDEHGRAAAHFATLRGHGAMLQFLIANGADVDHADGRVPHAVHLRRRARARGGLRHPAGAR
jgi:hypothetical protein